MSDFDGDYLEMSCGTEKEPFSEEVSEQKRNLSVKEKVRKYFFLKFRSVIKRIELV